MERIDIGAAALAYAQQGSGVPVLFIHGTGTYSGMFEPVVDELGASVRAITYDRRGFGSSAGPPARRFGDHVEDAAMLLEALDARAAIIVGSSSGGVLALRLAVARPELVSALILIEPAYQVALVPSPSTALAVGRVDLRWALRRDPEGAAIRYYRWATSYSRGGNQFDAYPEKWKRVAVGHARTALRELMQVAVPGPRSSALRQIPAPTSVLIGDAGLPVFHRTSRRVARAIPGAQTVPAPGAAHLVYTDRPDTCAEAIIEGARGVAAPAGR